VGLQSVRQTGLRSGKQTAFAASVAILIATSVAARAQGTPASEDAVAVVASRCNDVPWSVGAWVEILRAELAGDGVRVQPSDTGAAGTAAHHQVIVEPERCDAAASTATLTFSSGHLRRTRTLTLADVDPAARARVLAIAVADLVRQGIAAVRTAQPAPVPLFPLIDVRIRVEHSSPDPSASGMSASVAALAEGKIFTQGSAGLLGARLAADFGWGIWRVRADAGILSGSGHDLLGDVDETVATFGVGLLAMGGTRRISLGLGPRVEAGAGWFAGKSSNPLVIASSARSPIALLALSGMARFAIAGSWSGVIDLDVGASVYGFSATADSASGERHVTDLRGPFLATRLGFGWDSRGSAP
jgi:hypothetical protein